MNRTIRLSRVTSLFVAAAALAFMTAHAEEKIGGVTVRAERPTKEIVGRSATGEPIYQVQLSNVVSYADLELTIPSNEKVFKQRVRDAARNVCVELDRVYPNSVGVDACARNAEQNAKPQVDAAITGAQSRKAMAASDR